MTPTGAGGIALERGEYGQARHDWQQSCRPTHWLQRLRPDRIVGRRGWCIRTAICQKPICWPDSAVFHSRRSSRPGQPRGGVAPLRASECGRQAGRSTSHLCRRTGRPAEGNAGLAAPVRSADWPTFGGSPSRSMVMAGGVDIGAVKWQQELPQPPPGQAGNPNHMKAGGVKGPLSYFPLVVGKLLLVTTQNQIRAYNVDTGKPAWGSDPIIYQDEDSTLERRGAGPGFGTPPYTMTAYGNKLYAA